MVKLNEIAFAVLAIGFVVGVITVPVLFYIVVGVYAVSIPALFLCIVSAISTEDKTTPHPL